MSDCDSSEPHEIENNRKINPSINSWRTQQRKSEMIQIVARRGEMYLQDERDESERQDSMNGPPRPHFFFRGLVSLSSLALLEMLQQELITIQTGLGFNNFWIEAKLRPYES